MQTLNTFLSATADHIFLLDREKRCQYASSEGSAALGLAPAGPSNQTGQAVELWPAVMAVLEPQVDQVLASGAPVTGTAILPTVDGPRAHAYVLSPFFGDGGEVAGIIVSSRDVTDHEQALAAARRRMEQLHALAEAVAAISAAPNLAAKLQTITDRARAIIGAHQSIVSITLDQNWAQSLNAISLSDKYAPYRTYQTHPTGAGVYARVCATNRPLRLTQAELEAHPDWQGFGREAGRHPPLRGWLAVPLVGRTGQNLGLIQMSDKIEGEFTEGDEAILTQLAHFAVEEIENARFEQALSESELRFRTLFGAVADALLVYHITPDGPGPLIEVNDAAVRRYGYTRDELRRMTVYDLIASDHSGVPQRLARLQQEGTFVIESQHVTRHGRTIPTEVSAHFFHLDGRPTVLSVCRDITERKRAEAEHERLVAALAAERAQLQELAATLELRVAERTQALQQANQKLRNARDRFATLFRAGPVAAFIVRAKDRRIIDANDQVLRSCGYRREEFIGKTTLELNLWVHPLQREVLAAEVYKKGSFRNVEIQMRTRAGEIRTILASAEAIQINGEPCGLTIFVDITERKQAEEQIRALSKALTLAEQRERRHLSEVLHEDIQQMLFSAEMRAKLLSDDLPAAEMALHQQIGELRALLKQAIHTTRTLSIELNPPILHGEGLANALKWLARHISTMYGLAVDLNVADDIAVYGADQRVFLVQVVRELLFNVVKHAGVSHARVRATRTGHQVRVQVVDEGTGFDVQSAIYDNANRDSLGLFSIHERLRLFGGRLEIASRPGAGTRVELIMPLQADDAPDQGR